MMGTEARDISLTVEAGGETRVVSGLLTRPEGARFFLVMGHGAGAGMRHPAMESMVASLEHADVATLRYQFPYMERGGGPPDPQPVLKATVRAAVAIGLELSGGLPLFAGGRSMGGRMTSLAAADEALPRVRGIVFFGFPLHAAGKTGGNRADHLAAVTVPLLFVQGSRDALGEPELVREVRERLGERAQLHVVDGADHSFKVLKRSGRTEADALDEVSEAVVEWMATVLVEGQA